MSSPYWIDSPVFPGPHKCPTDRWRRPRASGRAHYVYTLDTGSIGAGSDKNLALNAGQVNGINYNLNFHMPHERFAFDSDNWVYLDNVKLEAVTITNAPPPPQPVTEYPIVDWNFDEKAAWYSYKYDWTQGTPLDSVTSDHVAAGFGVGSSNAWILQFVNSSFETARPSWAACGTGVGGPADFAQFTPSIAKEYKAYLDLRVEGLGAEQGDTRGELQIFLRAPGRWARGPLPADQAARFRAAAAGAGLDGACFAHATYLLNLASADEAKRPSVSACSRLRLSS